MENSTNELLALCDEVRELIARQTEPGGKCRFDVQKVRIVLELAKLELEKTHGLTASETDDII